MEDCSNDPESLFLLRSVASISKEESEIEKIHEKDHLSSRDYLDAFKIPLIEETRTRMLSCLNSISQSEYYKLLGVLPVESHNRLVYIDIDTTFGNHVARDGDVFLLSNQEPKELRTLDDHVTEFVFATDIEHNNHIIRAFRAKTICNIDSEFKYAIFLCNINESVQIWKTLHMSIEDRKMIETISSLTLIMQANKTCDTCATRSVYPDLFLNSELSEEQQVLATNIVSNSNCDQCDSIDVVWGMAGTGKTKVVAHVLAASCHSKVKMLVCAPNELQISSLSFYLNEELKKTAKLHHGLEHSIGDVLLLSDSVEVRDNITKEFCLEWRLNQIMPCMVWRGKLVALTAFLEKDFKKMFEKMTEEMNPHVLKTLRELFKRKSSTLMDSLMTLQKYSLCHTLSPKAATDLASLDVVVKNFNKLLAKTSITEEDTRTVFKINIISQAKPSTSCSSFLYMVERTC